MTGNTNRIIKIYKSLLSYFGPQHWWPGETPFEIIIGAILTQNTSWSNVETAIGNLKDHGLLDPQKLNQVSPEMLSELIRPSGYYNQKARKIMNFLEYLWAEYGGDIERMKLKGVDSLRYELLSIKGIGLETADSILLYALGKPVFVVDTYTYRIMYRHGFLSEETSYQDIQELFYRYLAKDLLIYNEYHALLVSCGKNFCKKKEPLCSGCPLKDDLKD
ncbi:endonuclease III domain-containing protein [bacterium]|nr:endonuclease III domain-containing protein [bacterium]